MARMLTKKQRGFVKDYLETGSGVASAKKHYNVRNDLTARVIASENLTKPSILNAIRDALPDELLAERHLELLNKRETHTWWEKKKGKNSVPHVVDLGPEVQAVSKGLDMAYKIKDTYAAEKSVSINVEVAPSERIKALADKLLKADD